MIVSIEVSIMLRKFKFEQEVYATLSCVPMATRRKLDRVGLKISLSQWQQLGRGERLAICHLPTELPEEREAIRLLLEEAVRNRCGAAVKELPTAARESAEPPASPTPPLVERARAVGVALGQREWDRLDPDERYALMKLGGGADASHNLMAALKELIDL
jgi:hypothetical protein